MISLTNKEGLPDACTIEKPPAATGGLKDAMNSDEAVKSWTPLEVLNKEELIRLDTADTAKMLYRLVESGRSYDEVRSIGFLLGIYACHGKCS